MNVSNQVKEGSRIVKMAKKAAQESLEDWLDEFKTQKLTGSKDKIIAAAENLRDAIEATAGMKKGTMNFNRKSLKNMGFSSNQSKYRTTRFIKLVSELQKEINNYRGVAIKMAVIYRDTEGGVHVLMADEEKIFNNAGTLRGIKAINANATEVSTKNKNYYKLEETYIETLRRGEISKGVLGTTTLMWIMYEINKQWFKVRVTSEGTLTELFSYYFFEQVYDFPIDSSKHAAVQMFMTQTGLVENQSRPDNMPGMFSEDTSLGNGRYIGVKGFNARFKQYQTLLYYLDEIINSLSDTELNAVLANLEAELKKGVSSCLLGEEMPRDLTDMDDILTSLEIANPLIFHV